MFVFVSPGQNSDITINMQGSVWLFNGSALVASHVYITATNVSIARLVDEFPIVPFFFFVSLMSLDFFFLSVIRSCPLRRWDSMLLILRKAEKEEEERTPATALCLPTPSRSRRLDGCVVLSALSSFSSFLVFFCCCELECGGRLSSIFDCLFLRVPSIHNAGVLQDSIGSMLRLSLSAWRQCDRHQLRIQRLCRRRCVCVCVCFPSFLPLALFPFVLDDVLLSCLDFFSGG